MAVVIINGPVITAGESLSAAVDCTAGSLLRITTPAAWDPPANLSFQVSSDGVFFNNAYDVDGNELIIPCGASRSIVVQTSSIGGKGPAEFNGVHLKFRSGSAAAPVPQLAQREFAIAIQTP